MRRKVDSGDMELEEGMAAEVRVGSVHHSGADRQTSNARECQCELCG